MTAAFSGPCGRIRLAVADASGTWALLASQSRNAISVAESTMRRDLELSKEEMGMVMTVFFLFYSLFQIPTGWLGDRWGTRRSLLV